MSNAIRIPVDITNPGQFFACCGLLEVAGRIRPGADGCFEAGSFLLNRCVSLPEILAILKAAVPVPTDPEDAETSPLYLDPLTLRIDWWHDDAAGGKSFKTWAGQQKIVSIVRAMHATFEHTAYAADSLFNSPAVLYAADEPAKPVQPLYFDARRAAQAQSIDVGFSPDAHGMMMPVYAAVEYLCLIGLQRFRPSRRADGTFVYNSWTVPLPAIGAAAAAGGNIHTPGSRPFAFSLLYRTKYLKGFLPANLIGDES